MSDLPTIGNIASEAAKAVSKELYGDLARPTARRLGDVLGEALEILLLPVHALALPAQKAHLFLKKNLADYAERLSTIPEDSLKAPPTELSVPLLQRFTYAADDDVRRLYIELLANASDARRENGAHPTFIHAIDRLSPDEARVIGYIRGKNVIPYVWIRMAFVMDAIDEQMPEIANGLDLSPDLTAIEKRCPIRFPENMPLYLSNLVSVGFLIRQLTQLSNIEKWYKPVETEYESMRAEWQRRGHLGKQYPVLFRRGFYKVTPLGAAFMKAVLPAGTDDNKPAS